jgi:hypothetical protein
VSSVNILVLVHLGSRECQIASIFSEEEIDGEVYLGLTESISTKQTKPKAGHMITVMKHVRSFESNDLVSLHYFCFVSGFCSLTYAVQRNATLFKVPKKGVEFTEVMPTSSQYLPAV